MNIFHKGDVVSIDMKLVKSHAFKLLLKRYGIDGRHRGTIEDILTAQKVIAVRLKGKVCYFAPDKLILKKRIRRSGHPLTTIFADYD